jgi:tetratricopeptide (TPR) repeat protein
MDARLRRLARWRLAAIPAVALLLLLLAWAGWSAWKRRPDPETQRLRAEAMALVGQDDVSSLARAVELLEAIQKGDHASRGAAGERGLAEALLAAAQAEEVEPLAERLAAAAAERARLDRDRPPGFEDAQRALAMEVTRMEVTLAPKRQKLEALRARAEETLRAVAAQPRGAVDAARGQAVLAVIDSNAEEVQRATALLRGSGLAGWADLFELWLAARRDPAARDQAIPRLAELAGSHPELLRARFNQAWALQAAGRREEAISAVGRLLAANPRHERGQRLRSQLATPPPLAAPAPAHPPQPAPQPPLPRPAPPAPTAASAVAPVPGPPPQSGVSQPVAPTPAIEVPLPPPPAPPRPKPAEPKPAELGGPFDPTAG